VSSGATDRAEEEITSHKSVTKDPIAEQSRAEQSAEQSRAQSRAERRAEHSRMSSNQQNQQKTESTIYTDGLCVEFEGIWMHVANGRRRDHPVTAEDAARLERFKATPDGAWFLHEDEEQEDEPGSPGTHMFEQMLGQLSEDCADWARKFDAQVARADALQRSIDIADAALQAAIDAEVDEVEADTGLPIDAPVGIWFDAEQKLLHYSVYGMSRQDFDAVCEFFDKEPWCNMSRTTCNGSCCEFCRGKQSIRVHVAKYDKQPPASSSEDEPEPDSQSTDDGMS